MPTGLVTWLPDTAASLGAALALPACQCVEAELSGKIIERSTLWHANRLGLIITARTAYRIPVAKVFVAAISERVPLSDSLTERIRTAVQEAVMNALMHGSLKLDPASRNSLAGMASLAERVEERLSAINVCQGAIQLQAYWTLSELRIVVSDGGGGFHDHLAGPPERALDEPKQGRGIIILTAICDRVAIYRRGATVVLRFKLDSPHEGAIDLHA